MQQDVASKLKPQTNTHTHTVCTFEWCSLDKLPCLHICCVHSPSLPRRHVLHLHQQRCVNTSTRAAVRQRRALRPLVQQPPLEDALLRLCEAQVAQEQKKRAREVRAGRVVERVKHVLEGAGSHLKLCLCLFELSNAAEVARRGHLRGERAGVEENTRFLQSNACLLAWLPVERIVPAMREGRESEKGGGVAEGR